MQYFVPEVIRVSNDSGMFQKSFTLQVAYFFWNMEKANCSEKELNLVPVIIIYGALNVAQELH